MGKYQAYPEYKDSGVEWLGKVPASWTIVSCRGIVQNKVDKNEGAIEQNYLSLLANVGVVTYEEKGDVGNKKPEDLSKCKIVRRGNLVINSMNYAIGSYGMSDHDGVCSPVYIVLEPITHVIERRLALRIFENKYFQKYLSTFGNGILEHRAAIGWDDIKNAYVAIPPFIEQQAILSFLDHETAKIDVLIEKQQQLIQLLKEKRQAVISHAVTKGLNPNAPMKDSGIEWLGEVPAHWGILKGGFMGRFFGAESISDDCVQEEGDLPFIKVSSLSSDGFDIEGITWFVSSERARYCTPESNYLAFPKRGAAIFTNKVNVIRCPSVIDPNLMGWKIHDFALTDYVAHVLKVRGLTDIADVSTVPQINNKHIAPEKFPMPPLNEQHEIINFISQGVIRLDSLLEKAESAIALMQERRTALISAAVTGKIDVRHFAEPATR